MDIYLLVNPIQNSHTLHMARLREEVEAADTLDRVPCRLLLLLLLGSSGSSSDDVSSSDSSGSVDSTTKRRSRLAANEDADVAGLGVDVAADVDDAAGGVVEELAEEVGVAALAGRVEDDDGLVGGVLGGDGVVGEEGGGVRGEEADAVGGEVVGARVAAGVGDAGVGDVDTDAAAGDEGGEGDGEEAGAGVGVDEVFDFRGGRGGRRRRR